MSPGPRQIIFQLHLWSALTVGLVLLVVAVTGALMVFRPELDPQFNRGLFAVTPRGSRLPLDPLVAAARQNHPEARVDFVRIRAEADASVEVAFLDKQVVFVDPYVGGVLGLRGRYEGFFGRCEQWHRFLLFGAVGKIVVRAGAMLTVVVLLTGFYLWLPPVLRALKNGLRLNFQLKGRAWYFNLHKAVGIYAGGVVLVSALTGLPQSFDWMEHGTYKGWAAAPAPPALFSTLPTGATPSGRGTLQSWLEQAQRVLPGASTLVIYHPRKPEAAVEIFAISPGAMHDNARSYLFLDSHTGAILRHTPYAESTAGVKFYLLCRSLHYGQFGGYVGRFLLLGGTLAVPLLVFTGCAMFFRRRQHPDGGP